MSTEIEQDHYAAKVDFSTIYDRPDPRAYYRTLGALDYEIPAHGAAVFNRLLEEMGGRDGRTVLDVCCSYGVNPALLNHDVDFADLTEHYGEVDTTLDASTLSDIDRRWFAERRRPDPVTAIGLDVAANAVRYASEIGLLHEGVVADLESGPCDEGTLRTIAQADLVTVTGGIGYIGERTFKTIVQASGDDPPWVAAFNLRWVDFGPIAEALEDLDLVVEHLDGYCVPQRRFADDIERKAVLAALERGGRDATRERREDAHLAELFVARPPEAVRDAPIADVLEQLTG